MTPKITLFVVFICLLAFSPALGDPTLKGHGHKTPHGGMVREGEGIHAEFLIDKSGQPRVYLYDKSMKPSGRTDLQIRLTVKGHGGAQHTRNLKPSGNPVEGVVFNGEPIKGLSDWDQAVVSLKIKDRWTHIRFSHH